jgi:drug/metabolite transporter (DMT)-like permease
MSANVLALVLLAALLHAGWNSLIKAGADKAVEMALMRVAGLLLALPVLAFTGLPARESWPWLLLSGAIHFGYYYLLAKAYERGNLSVVYPVMRGVAPVLVALLGWTWLGEAFSPWAAGGVAAVALGVLWLGLLGRPTHQASDRRSGLPWALLNAVVIAAYTLTDAQGVRASGNAVAYVMTLALLEAPPFALWIWWRRRGQGAALRATVQQRWPWAVGGAAASLASYGIALWAMTQAPVPLVAAAREASVLFAVLIGGWLLREPLGLRSWLAAVLVVAGLGLLRLAH